MSDETRGGGHLQTLAVALVVVVVLCAWLGRVDLTDPDEGRHAEIAREMLADGHYLTPRVHGQPYYDKPALFYWLLSASIAGLGPDATAARLPSALAALWTVLVTAWWARRYYGAPTARMAALGLATTGGFIALARHTVVDMLFCAVLTSALAWLGACLLDEDERSKPRSILPFYALLGLATLIKGPAALVLGGLVTLFAGLLVASGPLVARLRRLRPLAGGATALAVALPWYLAAWLEDPAYIETFLWHHNFARYASGGVSPTHQQAWYYYLVALPLFMLPWSPLVAVGAVGRLRRAVRRPADLYAALWAVTAIAFFWPARTRLVTYMLPALPPLLLLGSAWLCSAPQPRRLLERGLSLLGLAWTWLLAAAVAAVAVYFVLFDGSAGATLLIGTLPSVLVAAAAVRSWRRENPRALVGWVALSSVALVLFVYGAGAGLLNRQRSLQEAARLVRSELPVGGDLASYGCAPHSLAFYSGRTARRAADPEAALSELRGQRPAMLLTKARRLEELTAEAGATELLEGLETRWQGGRGLVLLSNR